MSIGSRRAVAFQKWREIRKTMLILEGFRDEYAGLYVDLHNMSNASRTALKSAPTTGYEIIFHDLLTTQMVLSKYDIGFVKIHALKMSDTESDYIKPMQADDWQTNAAGLLVLLKREGCLLTRPCCNLVAGQKHVLRWKSGSYYLDRRKRSAEQMLCFFQRLPYDTAIMEGIDLDEEDRPFELHVSVINPGEDRCRLSCSWNREPHDWKQIGEAEESARETAMRISAFFQRAGYVGYTFVLKEGQCRLLQIGSDVDLAMQCESEPGLLEIIRQKEAQKHERISLVHRIRSVLFKQYAHRKGFLNFMYRNWLRGLGDDWKTGHSISVQQKRWAHLRGFYSYRIEQYGLTESNYDDYLSDYTYKRLRPINNSYQEWFWNKILMYLVLSPFSDVLPVYYCSIEQVNGEACLIPFGNSEIQTWEQFADLLRKRSRLVLKKAVGSHGSGFHKISYRKQDGSYYFDDVPITETDLIRRIRALKRQYIVSEYVVPHQQLREIYDRVTPTVRIMTIRDSTDHYIKSAYIRIGTSSTGNTDNLALGGLSAEIDLQTGLIRNPEILREHVFTPCPFHPDTGVPVQGNLPHWEEVKAKIEEICRYVIPLEYLGFDVVITDEGFRILEINTHQELHKYKSYPPEVKAFFRRKAEQRGIVLKIGDKKSLKKEQSHGIKQSE